MQIRIKGLVAFFNRVRGQLQSGVPKNEVKELQDEIKTITRQVENLCGQYGETPASLPGPSRNAYHFLKRLDLHSIPVQTGSKPAPQNQPIKIRNVVAIGDRLCNEFWESPEEILASEEKMQEYLKRISDQCTRIERTCEKHAGTPANLPTPSQQVYCWLKFLENPAHLSVHLAALAAVKKLIEKISDAKKHPPLKVHLINTQAIYRFRGYRDHILLKCSEGFIHADEAVWLEILKSVYRKKAKRNKPLNDYIASSLFRGVIFEMESEISLPDYNTKGHVHDLDDSFQRVNEQYFQGEMEKPKIHWNRLLTSGKMGHYQQVRDTVMISVSLDQPEVPEYVIDYVMYHELLHKKLGSKVINGRRYAHTPAFRKEEKRFKQFDSATDFLEKFAYRQRGLPEPESLLRKLFSTTAGVKRSFKEKREKSKPDTAQKQKNGSNGKLPRKNGA